MIRRNGCEDRSLSSKPQYVPSGQYGKGTTSVKHYFNVDVATEVGINAAIIFENISFWINHNTKTGKNEKEGKHWMYATQKEIAEQFQYLTIKQTRTAIEKLIENDFIKLGCFNRHKYDRTSWYGLTEKGESFCPQGLKVVPSGANGDGEKDAPIPDLKKDFEKEDLKEKYAQLASFYGVS